MFKSIFRFNIILIVFFPYPNSFQVYSPSILTQIYALSHKSKENPVQQQNPKPRKRYKIMPPTMPPKHETITK